MIAIFFNTAVRKGFSLLLIAIALQGCLTRQTFQLPEGTPFFTSRVNPGGVTEFAFGLAWTAPPEESFLADRRGRRGAGQQRLAVDSSAAWKILMEEKAVIMLDDKLKNDNICDDNHEIRDVIWERNRVRLMGRCL